MHDTKLVEIAAPVGRRRFIAGTATAATLAALGPTRKVRAATPAIRIGYVSPQTGPLAAFGEADAYTLQTMKPLLAAGISTKAGKTARRDPAEGQPIEPESRGRGRRRA